MKKILSIITISLLCAACSSSDSTTNDIPSVRKERKAILRGNSKFYSGDYVGAIGDYKDAVNANLHSPEALFNLGVAQMAQANKLQQANDTTAKTLAEVGESNLSIVAKMQGRAFPIAALAYYNLANNQFRQEKYDEAIDLYKASLRINPDFNECRRNLRIAQLKKEQDQDQNQQQQQQQQQQQNQDKDQDQDQNKDQQNQDQNQDQNKDQNQDQQQQNKDQQQQQPQQMNQQTADQILQAMENKEAAARARLMKGSNKKQQGSSRYRKQW